MGDALLQKTVTTDFLTKKRVKNNGVLPQYYVEDDHEAIIPKDLFMQVQEELVRRRNVHRSPSGKKRVYSGNNCFYQIVVCGKGGDLYRRVHWYIHGKTSIVWRCISRLDPSSAIKVCTSRTIKEDWLKDITVRAFNQILTGKDEFLHQLQENMVQAIRESDPSTAESIQARLDELQKELITKANCKEDYDVIADEIFRLREEKEKADSSASSQEDLQKRITELQDFLKD
jgi:hypothetical protein